MDCIYIQEYNRYNKEIVLSAESQAFMAQRQPDRSPLKRTGAFHRAELYRWRFLKASGLGMQQLWDVRMSGAY